MNFWLKADFPLDQVPGALEISGLRLLGLKIQVQHSLVD